MSLSVYLIQRGKVPQNPEKVFLQLDGETILSLKEFFQEDTPTVLIESEEEYLFEKNITHNLGKMASEAGIYKSLWRPEELPAEKAEQLISSLEEGLKKLKDSPEYFRQFNPSNGWGNYKNLVAFTEEYLEACKEYPHAFISVSR